MSSDNDLLLEVNDLKMYFPIQKGLLKRTTGYVKAVDGVSLSIKKGETLGLVGESGCGKTTTGRCIVRVYRPTDGEIIFHVDDEEVNLNALDRQELKSFRRNMQMIFQDPFSSLNPRMTVLDLVGEPLLAHGIARGQELEDRVAEMVRSVGLRVEHLPRYPHSFSGGQRQRIGIARALVQRPKLVVCDEPVSALDVSVQSQVVNLLQDLQTDLALTYLFVAHDMSVVRQISNRIAVMYVGKLVEVAESEELLRQSQASIQRDVAFGGAPPQSASQDAAPEPGRRAGGPGQCAARLRFPSALQVHGRYMPDGGTTVNRIDAWPPRRLSLRRPIGVAGDRPFGSFHVLTGILSSTQHPTRGRSWRNSSLP